LKHGSLFSGIGGFDLAAEWMGWENVFHCEWNKFGQKILKHYWPKAISYDDITKTDFTIHRGQIDILTGGFPCQPYSTAGKRKGKEDERHLWPEMLRAIREIRPSFIVGENVSGLLSWNGGMVFDEVQFEMENEGYEIQPVLLPACAVNAPHRRDRIWFVAHSVNNRHKAKREEKKEKDRIQEINRPAVDTRKFNGTVISPASSNTNSERSREIRTYIESSQRRKESNDIGQSSQDELITNPNSIRQQRGPQRYEPEKKSQSTDKQFERYNKLSRQNWQDFPTQSPICSGDDGLSKRLDRITFSKWRNESIKGYGNAIVPQVAYEIFKSVNNSITK